MLRGRDRIVVTAEQERPEDRQAAWKARERMNAATDQALATVATTVVPALIEAREKLTPVAEQAVAQGKIRGKQAAALGLVKGRQAAKRFRAVEEPAPEPEKKGHKLRNFVLMLGLGGVAAMAYKMLSGKDADPAWTAGRDSAAAPSSPVAVAEPGDPGEDSVPWGDTAPDQTPGMDPSAVDPVVAEPAGSDPLAEENASSGGGAAYGSATAPTAPLASEETVESPVPTTPDEPVEHRDLT